MKVEKSKCVLAIVLILLAVLSFAVIAPMTSKTEFHKASISKLDDEKETVLKLTAAATGTSVALSALPNDTASSVASELIDLAGSLTWVLGAILLEKYLLTITCYISFTFLIPLGLILAALSLFINNDRVIRKLISKILLLGILLVCVVPASLHISSMIEDTYQESISTTLEEATNIQTDADAITEESSSSETEEQTDDSDSKTSSGVLDNLKDKVSDAADAIKDTASDAVDTIKDATKEASAILEKAKDVLNGFIEAVAIMVVTCCVIPVLVLVFFAWIMKTIIGIDINTKALKGMVHKKEKAEE